MDLHKLGARTLPVSRSALHGRIRHQFLHKFREVLKTNTSGPPGVVLLQGGALQNVYSTDGEQLFRQEAYMHYLFGVVEDSWLGAVDVDTGKSLLFMPRLPESYSVWMGRLKGLEEFKAKYAVDEVHYEDEVAPVLKSLVAAQLAAHTGAEAHKPGPLHVLKGQNSDSGLPVPGATFEGMGDFQVEDRFLFNVLTECRTRKTAEEIAIIEYANAIGSAGELVAADGFVLEQLGHVAMMRAAKPGVWEYQLEATYLHYAYHEGGCRQAPYTPICASGPNGAILHYGHAGAPNDRQLQDGDMVLVDCGCEYLRYGSDITCTWPANGKFTPEQRVIYNAVLQAQRDVIAAMKPGVSWPDMHTLANRVILTHLRDAGLVRGDVDELLAADIGALFMPHGLGHFLGIDTHDVGGYLPGAPPRIMRPGYKSLRTARKLEVGNVITVEPGCYFNPSLLLPAFEDPAASKYLVKEAIMPYMNFGQGGVRIEDNVVVEASCARSLTHVPRTVEEIEAVMAGGPWPLAN